MVNGKPDYASAPYFNYIGIHLASEETIDQNPAGNIILHPKGPIIASSLDGSGFMEYSELNYPVTFQLYKDPTTNDEYFLVDENGNVRYFLGSYSSSNETAFSGTPYEYILGSASSSGNFVKIRSTEEQLSAGCVPYLETVTIEGKITSIKYRFVDPATNTTVSNPDIYIRRLRIHLNGSSIDLDIIPDYAGEEYSASTPSLNPDDINMIEIRFVYKSENPEGIFQNPRPVHTQTTDYRWFFFGTFAGSSDTPDEPGPTTDESGYVTLPTDEDVQGTKDDSRSNLIEAPATFEAVESVNIRTGSNITFGDDISLNWTSSAIAISQKVAEGGAVVLGTGTLPVVSKSISGLVDLPPVNNFNELTEKYHVIKGFDGGGSVDLLKEFGSRAFDYDTENQKVVLKATIVIIDGPAPINDLDPDMRRPFINDIFGVKLSKDNKYLYIYDGNRNGVVKDPIALVAKTNVDENPGNDNDTNKGNGGGSGGCNAGFGIFGLLVAGVVTHKYRKV
jgi:hypothetical protein